MDHEPEARQDLAGEVGDGGGGGLPLRFRLSRKEVDLGGEGEPPSGHARSKSLRMQEVISAWSGSKLSQPSPSQP